MLSGGLGKPLGGWPKKVVAAVLGERKTRECRKAPQNRSRRSPQRELAAKFKRDITDDDLYSHLMYPEVFAEFVEI